MTILDLLRKSKWGYRNSNIHQGNFHGTDNLRLCFNTKSKSKYKYTSYQLHILPNHVHNPANNLLWNKTTCSQHNQIHNLECINHQYLHLFTKIIEIFVILGYEYLRANFEKNWNFRVQFLIRVCIILFTKKITRYVRTI